jgi:uncharacterized protein YbjT (DUF2867 family)
VASGRHLRTPELKQHANPYYDDSYAIHSGAWPGKARDIDISVFLDKLSFDNRDFQTLITLKILLTGANGYIGKRLLPVLVNMGHEVFCCVRDKNRFIIEDEYPESVQVLEIDFLKHEQKDVLPKDIDGAYYLIHSMSANTRNFDNLETITAYNFLNMIEGTNVKHVIYLGGIVNDKNLSKHLLSRKKVENILVKGRYNFTALRAGIILGSGSASFEIIRDLVEKLPFMITPKWVLTKSQPIAIRNVIQFLSKSIFNELTYNREFDIGGPDILSYKEMILRFAKIRGLKRWLFVMPFMSWGLSSYWLYFITSTSFPLAVNLVNSMKVPVIGEQNDLARLLDISLLDFDTAIRLAFIRIRQNEVISSWTDALSSGIIDTSISKYIQVPNFGCFTDNKRRKIANADAVLKKVWSIGGNTGWYYANWLWRLRGLLDRLMGGVGLRRGRTNPDIIRAGDALDFWRVLLADQNKKRLLLFAEMKLPGEAWLEFTIDNDNYLNQKATFRPRGIPGRIYWYVMLPFHYFIFNGMINNLTNINKHQTNQHT